MRLSAALRNKFDVAVIGGGPAGYACAIRAAQLGIPYGVD
jgi:flavin-dependent dehydrogenase